MLHALKFPTVTRMHDAITEKLVYSSAAELDMVSSVDVHLCNTVTRSASFDWEFDLKDLWLTQSRWNTMVRQYINPAAFDAWLNIIAHRMTSNSKNKNRGMALMRTNTVQARTHGKKVSRRWGSCMLAISFRRVPEPQITLYSRTSYFGYLASLDITVAHTCAQYVSEITGIPVKDMSFVWWMEDAQFSFKSMAYLFNKPEVYKDFEKCDLTFAGRNKNPGLWLSAKWWNTFSKEDENGILYGDMTWGACRRVRKRWHTEVFGYEYGAPFEGGTHTQGQGNRYQPLPSVPSTTLDFSCLNLRNIDPADAEGFVEMETE